RRRLPARAHGAVADGRAGAPVVRHVRRAARGARRGGERDQRAAQPRRRAAAARGRRDAAALELRLAAHLRRRRQGTLRSTFARSISRAPPGGGERMKVPMHTFLGYFARLGTFGFGGPIALAGYMQRDLVERRQWITQEEYLRGLALAQLMPGPLAAQLAIYLGWVRARVVGATLVAAAFILPSFVMVLALSAAYVQYGGLWWMRGTFYGIGAAVIAIIARSVWKLVRMTLARD